MITHPIIDSELARWHRDDLRRAARIPHVTPVRRRPARPARRRG